MSTLAVTLKAEISRLARKEVRSTSTALSSAMTTHRRQIASLKRRMQELEAGLRRSVRHSAATPVVEATHANGEKAPLPGIRFRSTQEASGPFGCRSWRVLWGQCTDDLQLGRRKCSTAQGGAACCRRVQASRKAASECDPGAARVALTKRVTPASTSSPNLTTHSVPSKSPRARSSLKRSERPTAAGVHPVGAPSGS
jgi:hypothetical protein